MATTFVKIATVTVGAGGSAAIEFTSIVGTYTDLLLNASTRSNRTSAPIDYLKISVNSSTTGYTDRYINGNGSTASSGSDTGATGFYGAFTSTDNATASTFGSTLIYIPNYSGSSNKSFSIDSVSENNGTTAGAGFTAGLWANTAAITSIKLQLDVGTAFTQYSTATLYGISKS